MHPRLETPKIKKSGMVHMADTKEPITMQKNCFGRTEQKFGEELMVETNGTLK